MTTPQSVRRHAPWLAASAFALVLAVYAWAHPERPERSLRHLWGWLGTAALAGCWFAMARALASRGANELLPRGLVFGGFVLFAAIACFIRPFHSSDVHAYVNVGQLQHAYGANPYVDVPADLDTADDPMISSTWEHTPCTYGCGFAQLARGVVALSGGDPARARLLFKLLGALGLALCAWLTLSTAARLGLRAEATIAALLLWSPWAVLHFVSNAHNDIWMALCLVLAARALLDGRWWLVVPALIAGALLKHLALVALPFFGLVLIRRHGGLRAGLSLGLGVALALFTALPYVDAWQALRFEEIATLLTRPMHSLSAALLYAWQHTLGAPGDAVSHVVRISVGVAFVLYAAATWLRRLPRTNYDARMAIADAATLLCVLLALASAAWFPWYPGMVLPLVLLLPLASGLRRAAIYVTAFQLLAFTPLAKARVLDALVTLALPLALAWYRGRRRADQAAVFEGASRTGSQPS